MGVAGWKYGKNGGMARGSEVLPVFLQWTMEAVTFSSVDVRTAAKRRLRIRCNVRWCVEQGNEEAIIMLCQKLTQRQCDPTP